MINALEYIILVELTPTNWIAVFGILATIVISFVISFLVLIFKSGTLYGLIKSIDEWKDDVTPNINLIPSMNSRIDTLWKDRYSTSKSPRHLNEFGQKILYESGVGNLINEHYDEILLKVKNLNPPNYYIAEEELIKVVSELELDKECKNNLEIGAFKTGQNITTLLFIGAIHIRDNILKELGLDVADIDKHDLNKKPEN